MTDPRSAALLADATVTVHPIVDPIVETRAFDEPELDPLMHSALGLWAVVFAGGIGSRFWPLSTARRPKQVLALVNERPLILDTILRLAPLFRLNASSWSRAPTSWTRCAR